MLLNKCPDSIAVRFFCQYMDFFSLLLYFLVVIPSSIIHEYAHAWTADQLGDKTARYAGRLTIDPRAHIELWGTILMPLVLYLTSGGRFMFAYAKPVPFNPYNLRDQKWGPALVGIAGPLANLLLAASFALLIRILGGSSLRFFFEIIVYANCMLLVFNLVPIPPLDGSKLLFAFFPDSARSIQGVMERYGMVIVLFFVFFLVDFIQPLISGLFNLLVG